jgi:hypothetical protein
MILGLIAVPLFLLSTWAARVVQHLAFGFVPGWAVSVPLWVALTVAMQAAASVGAVALLLAAAGWLDAPPSAGLLLLLAALALWIVWQQADEAEWERQTGWIAAPDDVEGRWLDSMSEVTARAALIGTAAGLVFAAVVFSSPLAL